MKSIKSFAKQIAFCGVIAAAMGSSGSDGTAARLIGLAMSDGRAYQLAESLSDSIGPRPSGSPNAARAVRWAVQQMNALGLKNVHTEAVRVPRWVRGEAEGAVVAPGRQDLHLVALGPSVQTPPEGITADVVEVASFDELKALGEERVRGKMVLFRHTMQRSHSFEEYGHAVAFRAAGPSLAARLGAAAALVRSVGTGAYRLPHTGALRYEEGVAKIPAAAVSVEDAELIHRLIKSGATVRVHLRLTSHDEGEVDSANVVGELLGRERPQEVVLLGAHLDSWDLGTGAIDDGAGCAIVIDAARLAGAVGRPPRRTIRVVLFMNEEMGLSGARAYAERHAAELSRHVAALEIDSGAGRATGFGALGGAPAVGLLRRLAAPLETLGVAGVVEAQEAGADLTPLMGKVPALTMEQELFDYFNWHHTAADTFDKIDAMDLAVDTAAVAVMAYGLADAGETLPPSPPSKRFSGPGPK
jgi:hypothetical protein